MIHFLCPNHGRKCPQKNELAQSGELFDFREKMEYYAGKQMFCEYVFGKTKEKITKIQKNIKKLLTQYIEYAIVYLQTRENKLIKILRDMSKEAGLP